LLQKNLPMLLLAQLAVLLLSTCVVFVDAGEQAVLEHFGKPVDPPLTAGAHLKLPWPVDKIYRYRTEQIQTFVVGYTPDTRKAKSRHGFVDGATSKEEIFSSATARPVTIQNENADTNDTLKAPPVSLITVSIPVAIPNHQRHGLGLQNADPTNLLQSLATREVVHFLAGVDLNNVMSSNRLEAAETLARTDSGRRERTQAWRENHFCRPAGHSSADDGRGRLRKSRRRGADEARHDSRRAGRCHQHQRAGRGAGVHDHERRRRDAPATGGLGVRAARRCSRTRFRRSRPRRPSINSARISRRSPTRPQRPQIRFARHEHAGRDVFDLEDKIREDLLNLNVPNSQSP
jgi:hypothetical protein